jgi:hypothetical protein
VVWAAVERAGAEQAYGHEQVMLEYDVPSNGTRRRSYGGGFPREIHEGQQAGRRGGKSKVTITARRVGRRSCGAKAAVRRDELGGASMQPSTTVLQEATRVCRPCFSGMRA